MLKTEFIGYLGADVEIKSANGQEFAAFRAAHTDTWKDGQGLIHENTVWVDVTLPSSHAVIPYLKKGTMVFVRGHSALRCYSSAVQHQWVAGLSIRCSEIQLLSSRSQENGTIENQPDEAPF